MITKTAWWTNNVSAYPLVINKNLEQKSVNLSETICPIKVNFLLICNEQRWKTCRLISLLRELCTMYFTVQYMINKLNKEKWMINHWQQFILGRGVGVGSILIGLMQLRNKFRKSSLHLQLCYIDRFNYYYFATLKNKEHREGKLERTKVLLCTWSLFQYI